MTTDKLIIANCSGFLGDRFSAAREMVEGGPIDVLTGDYLAELTMAILFRQKLKDASLGYARSFLRQMEDVMGRCLDRNIKVVSNAGGLNPKGLADALQAVADKLGLAPTIAYIEGDDLLPRLGDLQAQGETFRHLDKGVSLQDANAQPISANAYIGGWAVAEALNRGADIVVAGRLADAALVTGPAVWRFGWQRDDWDCLAGAAVAGHIIECGGQATGGNYPFIDEVPSFQGVGFPLAEIYPDGSSVITKHPGTGGLVSTGTVTAQLLYEIQSPHYLTPDVTARFDTIHLAQEGPDRVKVSGVKGAPPPSTTKVCLNNLWGYRNAMTLILTGLDIEQKARILEETVVESLGGRDQYAVFDVQLVRSDQAEPSTNDESFAYLRFGVIDPDPKKVARFSSAIVELALVSIPGFTATAPPAKGTPAIQHWPTLVANPHVRPQVVVGKERISIEPLPGADMAPCPSVPSADDQPPARTEDMVPLPFGRLFGTRSGDKGGNANLGVWARSSEAYDHLRKFLSVAQLTALLPDLAPFDIERYELPHLRALNFYIRGILGEGVAASLRSDPQAKTLGEYLRVKTIAVPVGLQKTTVSAH
ncbi:MAG: DUF1446 domain-containing protein [Deltaproteobacteria bacterium]|nr:DUF1446 domain-containing protein [Deltaproteobacteria bacterium]